MSSAAEARAKNLALYEKLVATNPDVKRKGATMPYTSVNGHMFSLLTKEGTLALRLPDRERETFLKRYKTRLCEQYGVVMKEYVEVPDALLKKTQELKKYFDLSFAYVGSLKPKPTTRKKPASPARKARTRTG
jgi:TfoX/Sxy family transcriptional regulator of competence genes